MARKEEARRKDVTKPVPGPHEQGSQAVGQRGASGAGSDEPAPAGTPADKADETEDGQPSPRPPASDEQAWRQRMADARTELEHSEMHLDALQSRINGSWAEFTAHDDPSSATRIEADRKKALAEFDRVKQRECRTSKKAIADLEEEARRASVPPGWLR